MATNFHKIDCHQVKSLFYETYGQGKVSALKYSSAKYSVLKRHRRQAIIKYAFPALEVHGETASLDKMSLDICTYIWNKMKKLINEIDSTIIKRAINIINI